MFCIDFWMRGATALFGPQSNNVFLLCSYDDMNTEKLRRAATESGIGIETEMFYFDPKAINWEDYLMNIHIPGIVKHVFKNT